MRQCREALGLTRKELAYHTGCSLSTIRKIEDGERRPSRQIAELLAAALRVPDTQREIFLLVASGERGVERLSAHPVLTAASPARCINLPTPATPLIGREQELAEIQRLLLDPACRLLTLTGEGGAGKTRLALEAGRRCASLADAPFGDGVCFTALAAVRAAEHILPSLAAATGFTFYGATDPARQVLAFLRDKQMLLILDNLEHLLAAAPLLAEMLAHAPGVKWLITSRQRLRLQSEWVFELQGLTYPVDAPALAEENLEIYSAITLFIQAARRSDRAFRLTPHNRAAVLRICQLVQGLPLGIELAASWMRTLPPPDIAQEIERDLNFLALSAPDLPERHRSLRAVFDHSWELLSAEEQAALARLAIFRGGFRREAAAAVAEVTLPILTGLVEKSLIHHRQGRYDFHELTRQYALAQLRADAQAESAARDRHSAYFFALLHARETHLRDGRQREALDELAAEIDNLRGAWEWTLAQKRLHHLRQAATSLMVYHELRNHFHEGEALFRRALPIARACVAQQPTDATCAISLADVLAQAGFFSFRLGRMAQSRAMLQESLTLLRQHDEQILCADVLWYYAFACWFSGDFAAAQVAVAESLDLNRKLGRAWPVAMTQMIRGGIACEVGDYAAAHAQLQEALALCRAGGDPRLISMTISLLARARHALGRSGQSIELLREGLQQASATGDRYGMGLALEQLARAAQAGGDLAEAQRLLWESITLFRQIGDVWSLSRALSQAGWFCLDGKEEEAAAGYFRQALEIATQNNVLAHGMDALAGLAAVQARAGQRKAALALITRVLHHPSSNDETRQQVARLRQQLAARSPLPAAAGHAGAG